MRRFNALGFVGVVASFLCLCAAGCGSSKNEFQVTGKITSDGEPIPNGAIAFYAKDGNAPVGGGTIKDGTYTAFVPPGEKIVTVTGFKITGQAPMDPTMPGSEMIDQREDVVAAKYAAEKTSPLTASIAGETKDLNFELEKGELVKAPF